MSSTASPRRRRGLRFILLATVVVGTSAFFAAPALANPCPNDTTDPFIYITNPSATMPTSQSTTIGTHTVTLTVTPTDASGGHFKTFNFTITDSSATNKYGASRVYANPVGPGEHAYNYTPSAVTSGTGLTPFDGNTVNAVKACLTNEGVLAVTLRSVTAKRSSTGVTVNWRTASEVDVAGYNVYGLVHGKRVKLNAHIIASKSSGSNSYAFSYRTPKGQRAPTQLWLQAINLDGTRTMRAARIVH